MAKKSDVLTIPVPAEFSFDECLVFLGRSAGECLFVVDNGKVIKALELEGERMLASITFGKDRLLVDFQGGGPGKKARETAVRYIKDWFDIDTDIVPFYRMAKKDPLLKPLVQKYYGLRLIGIPDLFEALCWAITGQQINLAFAYTLKRRLVETFGTSLQHDGRSYCIFPHPEVIAGLKVSDLKPLQYSEKKAEYLIGIAKEVASGRLSKTELLGIKSHEEVEARLTAIRGIGKWTAHYVMMKSLGHRAAFPVADVGLQNAIKNLLDMPAKPSAVQVQEMGRSWKGWEAYATFYLWRSLYDT